jgi:hypothetical protein
VLGQQVTVTGATTLAGRLVRAHGRKVAGLSRSASRTSSRHRALQTESHRDRTARADGRAAGFTAVAGGRLQLETG